MIEMGCDIHMYVEVKQHGKDIWETVGKVFENEFYDKNKLVTIDADGYSFRERFTLHPYTGRNYDLFGILANVRNGTWGEEISPISLPKGLPKDAGDFTKKEYADWNGDAHSCSWLTLKELESYDWHKKVKRCANVSEEQIKEYKETGKKPTTYAAWSSVGTPFEWEDTIYPKEFCEKTIPRLKALSKFGEVRIVFWFDN